MITTLLFCLSLSAAPAEVAPPAPVPSAVVVVQAPSAARWLVSQATRAWFSLALAGFALSGTLLASSVGMLTAAVGLAVSQRRSVATDVLLGLSALGAVGAVLSFLAGMATATLGAAWFVTDLFN